MMRFVIGLITLSCLSLSVLSDADDREALIYKVDIVLPPKEGRNEKKDILRIRKTLKQLSGIRVLFSFKELGNPLVILVLDVEKACAWSQLTGFLSRRGYEFSTKSLYHISDFARGLGVNNSDDLWATSFDSEYIVIDSVNLHVNGLSTLEYYQMMKWTVEKTITTAKSGQQMTCFKTLAANPVELFYIGPVRQSTIEYYEQYMHGPRRYQNEVKRMKNLDDCKGVSKTD
ncbi:uncharacterized protein LOC124258802 [Haliotis rubra]|uniref:uncharacterized protein LOC124258802 n=1 Tax=Haliotis rubra TaxID=36100 RepID=UPI001EE613F6|nr:uncharacterized protein LOC124258802 [Haliotis rubra]